MFFSWYFGIQGIHKCTSVNNWLSSFIPLLSPAEELPVRWSVFGDASRFDFSCTHARRDNLRTHLSEVQKTESARITIRTSKAFATR
eukprot:719590-Prorocentrum_minimum.AAC.3